jgi:sporulation protein YlmC with PRC-barrel domain
MTSIALRPVSRGVRRRSPLRRRRRRRLDGDADLLSVAGLLGSHVLDAGGRRIGHIEDLLVERESTESHPRLRGAMVGRERSRLFVPSDAFAALQPDELRLRGEPTAASAPEGLVALAHGILDRQIVDANGTDVTRVSDLLLGRTLESIRLVGVDVSVRTLLRRLGPARLRRSVARDRIYDWSGVAAFSERDADGAGSVLRLTAAAAGLRSEGPADIEALLSELPPAERSALADHVGGT